MRAGNTATPTKFEFCLRFPRCVKELLKRVTKTSFNYFTNPKASYYLKPKIKAVTVPSTDLAMFPKPSKGTIAQKHAGELAQWGVPQWQICSSKCKEELLSQRQAIKCLLSCNTQGEGC